MESELGNLPKLMRGSADVYGYTGKMLGNLDYTIQDDSSILGVEV